MNYQKHYDKLIDRAKNRLLEGYVEKHHIVPKCIGGSNEKDNLVMLTAREHFAAHLLLAKIHGGKLWHAANMMSNFKRYTSRSFEWVRKNHALEISKKLKGKPKTEEHKQNMKGHPSWNKGLTKETDNRIISGMTGKKHTEKSKQKQSESQRGEKNPNYGKPRAEETKRKISERNKGKISPFKGISRSIEIKNKISKSKTGKLIKVTEEMILEIQQSFDDGQTRKEIYIKFPNISNTTIKDIVARRRHYKIREAS